MSSNKLRGTALLLMALNCCSFLSTAAVLTHVSRQPIPRCVYLKNAHFDEYLYTASPKHAIKLYGNRVFTWRRKEDGSGKDWGRTQGKAFKYQAIWVLDKINGSCRNCYTIKSAYYKNNSEPLYAVSLLDHAFELARPYRPVYTYRGKQPFPSQKGQHVWKIEKVPEYSDRIRIKDKLIDEYLFAVADGEAHDQDRRNVFIWSSKENSDINAWAGVGDWIMEKAVCPPYV